MINKLLSGYFSILKGEKKAKFLRADIDSLIKETEKMMRSCELCERRCGVNRIKGKRYSVAFDDSLLTEKSALRKLRNIFVRTKA